MGCSPQEFPGEEVEAFGSWTVCYLYSPDTDAFISLVDFAMDDYLAPSTLESWERALGMEIPKPGNSH